jgi:telomere length regulation protein
LFSRCNKKKSPRFLASQFFERNYNIAQRLDILEILALSARELSSFGDADDEFSSKEEKEAAEAEVLERMAQSQKPLSQSDIIAVRIRQNTRRFSKKSLVKPKRTKVNQFAPVAGHFFFPLLNYYDRPRFA